VRLHDELDVILARLLAGRALEETIETLVEAGVPAGRVWPGTGTNQHPQLRARGFYEEIAHPVVGAHDCVTTPFRSRKVERWLRCPAPAIGQDNHAILKTVLGFSDSRIADLESREVIGTKPTGLD
jgi:crotonobetainyl-CoA:carnitine CoA-transferase CaiB-like acyl-CoA transferase